jgi:hypothetical protein
VGAGSAGGRGSRRIGRLTVADVAGPPLVRRPGSAGVAGRAAQSTDSETIVAVIQTV